MESNSSPALEAEQQPAPVEETAGQESSQDAGHSVETPDSGVPLPVLLEIALAPQHELFHDQYGEAYIWLERSEPGPHREVVPLQSREVQDWLRLAYWQRMQRQLKQNELADTIRLMSALARSRQRQPLCNRFAWHDGAIWLDMADPLWRVIKITESRWEITTSPRPIFRRHAHQRPLAEPVGGGNPEALFEFLPYLSEPNKLLLLAWTVLTLVPTIVHPALVPVGPQGAAKSSTCRRLREIMDPSLLPLLGEDNRRDLHLTCDRHAVLAWDNISHLSRQEADFFCRVITGGGTERRRLYTDKDAVIFTYRRSVMLNGLEIPSNRPDLLDRCIVMWMDRLRTTLPEGVLATRFAEALPSILGGVLDLLARTMAVVKDLPMAQNFRMADFAHWGQAVAIAAGKNIADFNAAYDGAIDTQAWQVIEQTPLAQAVLASMVDTMRGTPQALYLKLTAFAKSQGIIDGKRHWPGAAHIMSTQFQELVPIFRRVGVDAKQENRTKSNRGCWSFARLPGDACNLTAPEASRPNPSSGQDLRASDAGDASSQEIPHAALVERLDQEYGGIFNATQ